MIYVKKSSCPEDIQKDFDLQKAKPEWNDIPEEPNKEQARILREEFFDKLNKDQLRDALIKEQHGLCVYCMSRIENTAESTVIEHWYPLSKSKEKALQYENLFASCYGGQKETVKGVHRICCCDAKKHDASIKVDPRNERMMENIIYYSNGRIDFSESYATAKIRNTLRFVLGNLDGFTQAEIVDTKDMPELEKWVLHRLYELDQKQKEKELQDLQKNPLIAETLASFKDAKITKIENLTD